MLWLATDTVLALHKARLADLTDGTGATGLRIRRSGRATRSKPVPVARRPALAR
jgi:hypothetical protein